MSDERSWAWTVRIQCFVTSILVNLTEHRVELQSLDCGTWYTSSFFQVAARHLYLHIDNFELYVCKIESNLPTALLSLMVHDF